MLFTNKSLQTLEYDKIINMLSECASTAGAKEKAMTLTPSADYDEVILRQTRTDDAKRLVNAKGHPSFSDCPLVPEAIERADKGASLTMKELLEVASLLACARGLSDYIGINRLFDTSLDEIFARLMTNRALETKITKAILTEDMMADEASPLLAEIRRKIRAANNRIKETLQSFMGGARLNYLQENIVTVRNGRYVVPVKAEHKNEIKGLVHDTSASGATLFVEPMSVVEANNELRTLKSDEEHEMERILMELSADCAGFSSSLRLDYYNVTELAFYFACASLAFRMKAERPVIVKERRIDLKRARHPLIPREKVVPIDISVGGEFDTIIITGPNTGGKTVSLKTLGLLSLMAQSGLQIPADEKSEVGVFGEILVDIGDEQSIEESLSTFSSHMVNIVGILRDISDRSLVLFDELGAGTDPIEGAALAVAILEKVRRSGAACAATTHYAELKAYALETEGVQNASCEFDINTLRPTYRLIIGAPGKSNAFAISEKLGLDPEIVSAAKSFIENDNKRFEDVIEKLDNSRIELERQKEIAERLRVEYERFKNESEEKLRRRMEKSEKEISDELAKARRILDSARASSEFIFRQLEDVRKQEDREKRNRMAAEARKSISDSLRRSEELYSSNKLREISLDSDYKLPRELVKGDRVYVVTLGCTAEVTSLADRSGNITVKSGVLTAKVPLDKLRLLEGDENIVVKQPQPAPAAQASRAKLSQVTAFKPEADVRGMIGEDAWFVVDKYLDDAILAGVNSVRIIHGKGTGALRAYLWKNFKTDKRIKSYRHGEYGEGDAGVTVITLK